MFSRFSWETGFPLQGAAVLFDRGLPFQADYLRFDRQIEAARGRLVADSARTGYSCRP